MAPDPEHWNLRLYVAGQSLKSLKAFANLTRLCEERLQSRYDIEIVDLVESPQLDAAQAIAHIRAICDAHLLAGHGRLLVAVHDVQLMARPVHVGILLALDVPAATLAGDDDE